MNAYEQRLEMLYQELKQKDDEKIESIENKSKASPYSPFGAFCISWWSDGGLAKINVQDEGRAHFLFEKLSRVNDRNCSLVILTQDDKLIKSA